jgi:general nucleoside transport system permease protein
MSETSEFFLIAVAAGAIRSGTPVLYAALGEILTQKSGILNLGLEGIMLVGALVSVIVSYHTGSPVLGVGAALISGAVLGLLHAVLCIRYRASQVAVGIAITIFGTGLSAYAGISYVGKKISALAPVKIPLLSNIPIAGEVFFSHDMLVYGTYLVVPAMAVLLYRTRFGLFVQAVGENPHAAAASGIRVESVRYISTAIGASLAGVGGAYLSLVYAQGWVENMTVGRGLVAVGLVIFSAWNPWRAVLGAYLFGGATSLQLRLQAAGSDVSPYLMGMVPYILVITVLTLATIHLKKKRSGIPSALGKPYISQL